MAQPYWITESGSLGTINEQEFYKLQLNARDPEEASNNDGLTFEILAGNLPGGIALAYTGVLDGIPQHRSLTKGIPYEVDENVTSTFVVRVTDAEGLVADRTFSITVQGPDSPVWSTAAGTILTTHDGQVVDVSCSATDSDTGDTLKYTIVNGNLPPGLVMDSATGRITGRILKVSVGTTKFEFDVVVSDGLYNVRRRFDIIVNAINDGRADRTQDRIGNNITVDSTSDMWLADVYKFARPFMLTKAESINVFRHANVYIEKFSAQTIEDLPTMEFEIKGSYPPELTFVHNYENDSTDKLASSLLHGTIPSATVPETRWYFSVRPRNVYTENTDYDVPTAITLYGDWVDYTLTVRGDRNIEVSWS